MEDGTTVVWSSKVERSASNLFFSGRRKRDLLVFCATMSRSM